MNEPLVKAEDAGVSLPATAEMLTPPHGLEEILKTFGDIYEYLRADGSLDPRWQADFLARIALPFALVLSWDHSKSVSQLTCHKRLTDIFAGVFERILTGGLHARVKSFGGCFAFRPQRNANKLSAHSCGIAIDLNPETNVQGTAGDMDTDVIEIFRSAGFLWGGDWAGARRDPMHFQFCTGY